MLRYIIFDLETQNLFQEVGSNDPAALDISVVTAYDSGTDKYTTVSIDELSKLWPIFEHADALVGFNSNHFDIPILNKYYPGDLTQIKSIDLLEEIKKYCEQDVKVTKKVFDYAMTHGHVKFKDGSRKPEIPLATSHWLVKEEVAMTHSLLF